MKINVRFLLLPLQEGKYVDALHKIEKAMKLSPERRNWRILILAKIHKQLGNYEEAERQLKAILQCEESKLSVTLRAQVYIELAEKCVMCSRYDLAREHLISALKEAKETLAWENQLKAEAERVSKKLEGAEKAAKSAADAARSSGISPFYP